MKYTHTDTNHAIENEYPKLVRDKIPEIVISQGKQVSTRILQDDEYITFLLAKLIEESTELVQAETSEHQHEELADVFEVLESTLLALGITREDIQKVQDDKNLARGSFHDRILMLEKPE